MLAHGFPPSHMDTTGAAMNVDLYALCWNDAAMLGFFFRHYDRLITRYRIFDDGSSDASLAILANHPRVEIRPMPPLSASIGTTARALEQWNHCWKESRGQADWVIVTEIDEHLDHPDLPGYLRRCREGGITVVPALGYQMLSPKFPSPEECLRITHSQGAPFARQSKLSIFDPNAIEEIAYALGRHTAAPTGRVRAPSHDEVVNRHYKYLGIDYVHRRNTELRARLNDEDAGLAHRWWWGREELLKDWASFEARLVDLAVPGFDPGQAHPGPRWWDSLRVA
jgi:hypothetical protein